MTWILSEAQEQEYYDNQGGRVIEFACELGHRWEAVTLPGDELPYEADECPRCGRDGEEL